MRIVFIGAVNFSYEALKHLISMNANVVGVFSQRDRGVNADFRDLSSLCSRNAILFQCGDDVNSTESLNWIRARSPDVIFCFGWSRLLGGDLLKIPKKGIVGFHPSALPQNRGRHPIIWALVLGLRETASTFFFIDEGVDSGDVISQKAIKIDYEDSAADLYQKITETALQQLTELLPRLERNEFVAVKQVERLGNTWRKRGMLDGKIDWRMSADSIRNLVRGMGRPYVGAEFLHNGERVKVWKCEILENAPENIEPGKIIEVREDVPVIKCGSGAIILLETDPFIKLRVGDYL